MKYLSLGTLQAEVSWSPYVPPLICPPEPRSRNLFLQSNRLVGQHASSMQTNQSYVIHVFLRSKLIFCSKTVNYYLKQANFSLGYERSLERKDEKVRKDRKIFDLMYLLLSYFILFYFISFAKEDKHTT